MRTATALVALACCLAIALPACTNQPVKQPDRSGSSAQPTAPEQSFVSITQVEPSIIVETRYFTGHNFVGERIRGYNAPRCMLTRQAAQALARVQRDLEPFGLAVKTYDCYRPQRAVDHFVEWAKDRSDTEMKAEFYPNVDKANLFRDGYIAERSGHSRGSTVDLTIVPLPVGPQDRYVQGEPLNSCVLPQQQRFEDNGLDMGTGFDCFDPLSNTENPTIGDEQQQNRLLLNTLMERHGFEYLPEEWWHFTLRDEPYPDTYFDFPIG
ncbi:MAG: M15 family metallopeptidase [Pseudonocardiaceae bacterium]